MINIKKVKKDIGKGKNNLIFNFPDDDFYNDVKVTVLTKEK